jgi:hypothetical protein
MFVCEEKRTGISRLLTHRTWPFLAFTDHRFVLFASYSCLTCLIVFSSSFSVFILPFRLFFIKLWGGRWQRIYYRRPYSCWKLDNQTASLKRSINETDKDTQSEQGGCPQRGAPSRQQRFVYTNCGVYSKTAYVKNLYTVQALVFIMEGDTVGQPYQKQRTNFHAICSSK